MMIPMNDATAKSPREIEVNRYGGGERTSGATVEITTFLE
jgi:hypothetical protein